MQPLPASDTPRWRTWLTRYGLVAALLVICGAMLLHDPRFLAPDRVMMLFRQNCTIMILAIGVTCVLLTGGVDLSLGSVVALSGVVAALFAQPNSYPLIVPILLGMLTGLGCGALNGLIVTRGRVAPFIATLGMMAAARGLALVLSRGQPVSNLNPTFKSIAGGDLLGVPIPVFILVLVAVATHILLQKTRVGRYCYAVGGNEQAAFASGIRVSAVKLQAYALCGALAGLAGVVLASRTTTGQPNAAIGYELDAIAAAVIGGTSLAGGVGGVAGTLLGAILMGIINTSLDQLNVNAYYQQIVKGTIIVGAVWLDRRGRR